MSDCFGFEKILKKTKNKKTKRKKYKKKEKKMKEIHRQGPKRGEDLPYLNRFLKRPKREEDGTCRIALNRFSKIIPQILILILILRNVNNMKCTYLYQVSESTVFLSLTT